MDSSAWLKDRVKLWPGRSYPLGATWDGEGVNFALFSAHAEAVDLCLFDPSGQHEVARVRLPEYTDQIWHGYLPDARPGLLYGYRVYGRYRPEEGYRFNPNKLLMDPYARSVTGPVNWSDALFCYRIGSRKEDLSFDRRDSARFMPKCRVVESCFTWGHDRSPQTPWEETVICEMHVKGYTARHPDVEAARRGTFAGLVAPPVLDYLVKLGVTAVELLPVHYFANDRHLLDRGLTNYWGYNTAGFFAPDPRYLATGDIGEFKTMVKRLHHAGIEVILDVVYNHTAEGNHMGPMLSFRGIDNPSYYCLTGGGRYYMDYTGTGNSLNLSHPRVLQMVMDSLRYWVSEMHVDGFRFDLCPTLARENGDFTPGAAFLDAVRQDPVLNTVKLIAEPWDVGPNGYQLGHFPPGWGEWNAAFRDTVRQFWKGDEGVMAAMASRVAGSADIFERAGRRPWSSVNFVTAHDGFTLQDVVSYNDKHNEANGEDNRDGHNDNHSWNWGVEGPSDDPALTQLRDRLKRSQLATLLLSLGVPMILAGDECGRSQNGNNNAYCQDNEVSWLDWETIGETDLALRDFVARLIQLRRRHRVFSRPRYLLGKVMASDGLKDITWITPEGRELDVDDWTNPQARSFGYVLGGAAGEYYTPGGQRDVDDSFMVLMSSFHEDLDFQIPQLPAPMRWELLLDTAETAGFVEPGQIFNPLDQYPLRARSLALLVSRKSVGVSPAYVQATVAPQPLSALGDGVHEHDDDELVETTTPVSPESAPPARPRKRRKR